MGQAILNRGDRVFLCVAVIVASVAIFSFSATRAGHAAPSTAASHVAQPLELARVHSLTAKSVRAVSAF